MCLSPEELDKILHLTELRTVGTRLRKYNRLCLWLLGEQRPNEFVPPPEGEDEATTFARRAELRRTLIAERCAAHLRHPLASLSTLEPTISQRPSAQSLDRQEEVQHTKNNESNIDAAADVNIKEIMNYIRPTRELLSQLVRQVQQLTEIVCAGKPVATSSMNAGTHKFVPCYQSTLPAASNAADNQPHGRSHVNCHDTFAHQYPDRSPIKAVEQKIFSAHALASRSLNP